MFEAPTLDTLWGYNLQLALPALWLASSVMLLLLIDLFTGEERKHWTPLAAMAFIVIAFIMQLFNFNPTETTAFGGMFAADAFTSVLNIVALGSAFLAILISGDYLKRANIAHGEYYALLLLSASGAMFMAAANDLILMFVALEVLSIPLYILAAFRATDPEHISRKSGLVSVGDFNNTILKSEESGMKYFILGAFSSAFFVYGAALIYGATGTTNLPEILTIVQTSVVGDLSASFLLMAGTALAVVGLGFKVAAVPFHMWTPDVYEGAPTPVTAFMSVVAKVGGFGALLRLMITGLQTATISADVNIAAWVNTIQVIAAVTLILGNVVAISQINVKRMLAYSSIAHAGYILMAVAAVGVGGVGNVATAAAQGTAVYLLAYMFTNIGAFAVVQAIENVDGSGTNLDDFAGLFNSKPLIAIAMTVFMLSLVGIPLTGGFFGKWLVFGAAVQSNLIVLAVIGVLTSVISAFYYMRVVVNMFLREDAAGSDAPGATRPVTLAIYAAMAGVLITGIIVPLVTNLVNPISF